MRLPWATIGALGLVTIVAYGACYYAYGVLIGPIAREASWSQAALGAIFGAVLLVNGVLGVLGGRLLDRTGSRALFAFADTLAGAAPAAHEGGAVGDGVIDVIFERFHSYGVSAYLGEPVTLTEHMLQTALAAEADGAHATLVAAALLHDYGHLIHELPEDSAEHGIDTRHEDVGFEFLARHFPPAVVDPVRLHVAAKRYLCAVEPEYLERLSAASRLSLDLQGGPFGEQHVREFRALPYWQDAVRLRRYDDIGKEPGRQLPDLERFRALLESVLIK